MKSNTPPPPAPDMGTLDMGAPNVGMPEQGMPDMGGEVDPMSADMSDVEGEDPKKDIQQKTGKMTNLLTNYQGDDKKELAKYVKGMVDKAADNIIDGDEPEGGEEMAPQMESLDRFVSEIVNDITNKRGDRNTKRGNKKITNDGVTRRSPFVANR